MHYRALGQTGLQTSLLSFGASSLGSVFRETSEKDGIYTVHLALDSGVNFIDVAPYYGATKAETVLGKALRGVRRDRYIIATKIGQYGDGEFDFSAKRVEQSLNESCQRLGVDHVDLLQCHDIEFADLKQIVEETLPALRSLRDQGRIGRIGITGLPLKIFTTVIEQAAPGTIDTILSFCHYELNDNSLEQIIPLCAKKNIGVINASPTGMGLLTNKGGPSWHPAPAAIKDGCRRAAEYCQSRGEDIVKVAIQYSVSHPSISTTLVSSANPENIRKNIEWALQPIDFELMASVLQILKPIHNLNFTRGRPENRDPLILSPC